MIHNTQSTQPEYLVVKASRGFAWMKDGTELIRGNFGRWFMLFFVYLVLFLFSTINVFTSLLFFIFHPVLWAGIFLAAVSTLAKLEWSPSILLEPLKKYATELIKLGSIIAGINYLIAMLLISYLSGLVDIEQLDKLLVTMKQTNDATAVLEFFSDPLLIKEISLAFLVALLVALPLTMAGWYAPVLIIEKRNTVLQALRVSFQACTANFMAFLVYGLVGLVLMLFVAMSMYIALIFVGPLFFTSYYCSYIDIFPSESQSDLDEDQSNSTFVV
jgi:hypothetical protein